MRSCLRLFSSWKFLPNRDRIFFKDRREAFREYCRLTGANFLVHVAFAAFIAEFAFPTPDIMYDIRRAISPDFDLYCRHGDKAVFSLELSNQVRMFKAEQERVEHDRATRRSPEARFGGAV
ncbi:unnamed protein product [Nippostrongylus brasiliensis]|uniref:Uncharacterized protein n=1 Tax=Nippostrongylus brasiliensis TaxID=27835 RepID=A0A0N4Y3G1_NIPBR|nr:hypothetical protein Q1695_015470 [Nippostrongylus brasiliensis]VDL73934.1 unnamed protein product [Nippostrongylus brasiliensis]